MAGRRLGVSPEGRAGRRAGPGRAPGRWRGSGWSTRGWPPAALSQGDSPLTAREREVLAASRGHPTVAELAGALHLSQGTVRNYISAAISKLDARNRLDAVRIAEDNGWL